MITMPKLLQKAYFNLELSPGDFSRIVFGQSLGDILEVMKDLHDLKNLVLFF